MTAADRPRVRRLLGAPGLARVPVAANLAAMGLYLLDPRGAVGEVAYLLTFAGATSLAWIGVHRHPAEDRGPWTLVATAATVTMLGDLTHQLLFGARPEATPSDVLWIGAYATLLVGLLRLAPLKIRRDEISVDSTIDTFVAVIVGLVVAWEVALDDLLDADGSTLDRVVSGAYPVLDVVLLAVVVRLLLRGDRAQPVVLATIGALVLLVADLAFVTSTGGAAEVALTLGWMVALLLLSSSTLPSDRRLREATSDRLRMWLALAPVGVPIGFLLWGQVSHDHPNTLLMLASAVSLLGLALARTQRLLRAVEEARSAVEAREHRFRALAANASDAVCIADGDGVLVAGADRLARLLGAPAEALVGTSARDDRLLADPPAVQLLLRRVKDVPGVVVHQDIEVRAPDGSTRWWEARLVNLLDDPVIGGIVANIRDITDRRRIEDELRLRAFRDEVTGLANRALLHDRVEQLLRASTTADTGPALLHLHLDGLKAAVEQHGHEAGDRLLRQVADRLRQTVRSEDTIARVGAHELAVLIEENHAGTDEAMTTAERITQVLTTPLDLEDQAVVLPARVGLAVADLTTTVDDLLRHAAMALDGARASGGPSVVAYRAAMGVEAHARSTLVDTLPRGWANGELELRYEPVVRLDDGALVGFAAEPTWRHPDLGLVPTDRLRAIVEDSDVAPAVDRWVLHAACTAAAAWRGCSPTGTSTSVGVHLSARQLLGETVVADVAEALEASGLEAGSLVVEVAEDGVTADAARAGERLRALAALGVRVAVDDFGSGPSSLTYLRDLPVHLVKVDRAFAETIDDDADDVTPIVRGLLDLAGTLGFDVVAEGVTSPAQRDVLRHAGCRLAQGPLFADPVTGAEAARLVARAPWQAVP